MKNKSLFLVVILVNIFLLSCSDKISTPKKDYPECKWSNTGRIVYFNLLLKHPTTTLLNYNYIYTNNDGIHSLNEIYGSHWEQKSSVIKVITTANGNYSGVLSKTDEFTTSNYINNVGICDISGVSQPTESYRLPTMKVEIKSGLHQDLSGAKGYVVWAKAGTTNYSNQDGIFIGVFKAVQSMGIVVPERIYKNGNFVTF